MNHVRNFPKPTRPLIDDRTDLYFETVPEPDRHKLADLKPSDRSYMPLATQQKLIKIMQNDPAGGYAYLSPSGWSKSTFLYALYYEALLRHDGHLFNPTVIQMNRYTPVVFVEAAHLLDQIEAFKYREGPVPDITVAKIERMVAAKIFFTLIIDEFEKVKKSEFRMVESYNILNAMYKARGNCQLVIAGNLTKEDLQDKYQYLEGTFRRIVELTTTKEGKTHFWEINESGIK
jgi:hypothetical protein